MASWNFAGTSRTDCLEVSGTRGKLTLALFADEPLLVHKNGLCERFDSSSQACSAAVNSDGRR